jgi:hypothetical protein
VLLLVFFSLDAALQFWYDYGLIAPCFVAGLLGGAVYVHGFSLVSRNADPELRELALVTASISGTR